MEHKSANMTGHSVFFRAVFFALVLNLCSIIMADPVTCRGDAVQVLIRAPEKRPVDGSGQVAVRRSKGLRACGEAVRDEVDSTSWTVASAMPTTSEQRADVSRPLMPFSSSPQNAAETLYSLLF